MSLDALGGPHLFLDAKGQEVNTPTSRSGTLFLGGPNMSLDAKGPEINPPASS